MPSFANMQQAPLDQEAIDALVKSPFTSAPLKASDLTPRQYTPDDQAQMRAYGAFLNSSSGQSLNSQRLPTELKDARDYNAALAALSGSGTSQGYGLLGGTYQGAGTDDNQHSVMNYFNAPKQPSLTFEEFNYLYNANKPAADGTPGASGTGTTTGATTGATTGTEQVAAPAAGLMSQHLNGYAPATIGGSAAQVDMSNFPQVVGGTATAGSASATGYDAQSWDAYIRQVTPEELSRFQLGVMLDEKGDYVRRAQQRGLQTAQSRGLLNSSMAAGASHAAAIDAAQPFALQDASTFARQALANQDMMNKALSENAAATNTARQFGAEAKNKASLANAEMATQVSVSNANNATQASVANANNKSQALLANMEAQNKALVFDAQSKNEMSMQVLKGAQAEQLANIESANKLEIQTRASAADLYKQITTNITTINSTKDISAAQQKAATSQQMQLMDSGMKIVRNMSNVQMPTL
jgi:hypothetical protein